ncbi:MAG: amidohydrolase family protein [Verrucomicrobia bacterium]|nr:amidohydrolase family protein [Verrucomicrobiota bacterium]
MILRARTIVPVAQPPIDDGVLCVSNSRITEVAKWTDVKPRAGREVLDLGEVLVMPGLVNAHCHLDYTEMRGQIPSPRSFPDWIKALLALKAQWTYSDYAQSWLHGAKMLVRRGVTCVGDIEAVPELLPEAWTSTPLRVLSFLEMTGVKARRPVREILSEAIEKIGTLAHPLCSTGLSPHAPYSTTAELLELAARTAHERRWRLCIHVAESLAEFDMFVHRRGPLYNWLKRQRDMTDCGHGSPIQRLEQCGLLSKNLLAVHVNYLARGDAELLGRRGVSVAHCPRSHRYFGHAPFPQAELAACGVNICLGTDSLVSVTSARRQKPELDLFAEMRAFAGSAHDVSPETVVRMATVNGARALGMEGKAGELSSGAFADIIVLPARTDVASPYEAIVNQTGDVAASMINGTWVVRANPSRPDPADND